MLSRPGGDDEPTRLEVIEAEDPDSPYLTFPEVPAGEHLLEYISEMGYQSSNSFGVSPISYQDIYYWSKLADLPVGWWEVKALRAMSAAYIDQSKKSTEELCPPPWQAETLATPERREKVNNFFHDFAERRRQTRKQIK